MRWATGNLLDLSVLDPSGIDKPLGFISQRAVRHAQTHRRGPSHAPRPPQGCWVCHFLTPQAPPNPLGSVIPDPSGILELVGFPGSYIPRKLITQRVYRFLRRWERRIGWLPSPLARDGVFTPAIVKISWKRKSDSVKERLDSTFPAANGGRILKGLSSRRHRSTNEPLNRFWCREERLQLREEAPVLYHRADRNANPFRQAVRRHVSHNHTALHQ